MQFLLLVCIGDDFDPPESIGHDTEVWVSEMTANGVRTVGDRLLDAGDAMTVRVRAGDVRVSNGSEVDVRRAIAGFDLIECADLQAAIDVAAKHPMASAGAIEIRPVWRD